MPIFHTEHCVFARFLSGGNSYQDCGHVCTRNTIHLRDQNGKDNLVLADMGCRNTVFNSASQSGVYSIDDWKRAGINRLRIELVDESGDDSIKIVSAYMQHLSGQKTAWQVWQILENEIRDRYVLFSRRFVLLCLFTMLVIVLILRVSFKAMGE